MLLSINTGTTLLHHSKVYLYGKVRWAVNTETQKKGGAIVRLKDRVAIVTGGGVGIGKSIALAFAKEGAHVVVAARTLAPLEETVKQIKELGRKSLAIGTDVAQEDQVKDMVDKTITEFDQIDILVANSGIAGATKPVVEVDLADWNDAIERKSHRRNAVFT